MLYNCDQSKMDTKTLKMRESLHPCHCQDDGSTLSLTIAGETWHLIFITNKKILRERALMKKLEKRPFFSGPACKILGRSGSTGEQFLIKSGDKKNSAI